jgi:hypothetical protein
MVALGFSRLNLKARCDPTKPAPQVINILIQLFPLVESEHIFDGSGLPVNKVKIVIDSASCWLKPHDVNGVVENTYVGDRVDVAAQHLCNGKWIRGNSLGTRSHVGLETKSRILGSLQWRARSICLVRQAGRTSARPG